MRAVVCLTLKRGIHSPPLTCQDKVDRVDKDSKVLTHSASRDELVTVEPRKNITVSVRIKFQSSAHPFLSLCYLPNLRRYACDTHHPQKNRFLRGFRSQVKGPWNCQVQLRGSNFVQFLPQFSVFYWNEDNLSASTCCFIHTKSSVARLPSPQTHMNQAMTKFNHPHRHGPSWETRQRITWPTSMNVSFSVRVRDNGICIRHQKQHPVNKGEIFSPAYEWSSLCLVSCYQILMACKYGQFCSIVKTKIVNYRWTDNANFYLLGLTFQECNDILWSRWNFLRKHKKCTFDPLILFLISATTHHKEQFVYKKYSEGEWRDFPPPPVTNRLSQVEGGPKAFSHLNMWVIQQMQLHWWHLPVRRACQMTSIFPLTCSARARDIKAASYCRIFKSSSFCMEQCACWECNLSE